MYVYFNIIRMALNDMYTFIPYVESEKTEKTIFFHNIYLPAKYGFFSFFSFFPVFSFFFHFLVPKTQKKLKKPKKLYFSTEYIYLPNTVFSVFSVLAIICLTTNLQPNPANDKKQKDRVDETHHVLWEQWSGLVQRGKPDTYSFASQPSPHSGSRARSWCNLQT